MCTLARPRVTVQAVSGTSWVLHRSGGRGTARLPEGEPPMSSAASTAVSATRGLHVDAGRHGNGTTIPICHVHAQAWLTYREQRHQKLKKETHDPVAGHRL